MTASQRSFESCRNARYLKYGQFLRVPLGNPLGVDVHDGHLQLRAFVGNDGTGGSPHVPRPNAADLLHTHPPETETHTVAHTLVTHCDVTKTVKHTHTLVTHCDVTKSVKHTMVHTHTGYKL